MKMTTASTSEDNNKNTNTLRVALCQFHVTEHQNINHATCRDYLQQAAAAGAQLVVLPEIWASPYATAAFADYAEILPSVHVSKNDHNDNDSNSCSSGNEPLTTSSSAELLRQAAREFNYWIVGGSLAEKSSDNDNDNEKIYNTSLVFNPQGQVVAKHRKVHLFDINVPGGVSFYESETLSPGNTPTYFDLTIPSSSSNNNNNISAVVRIGLGICYDIRFAAYSMLLRQAYGCQVLIFPGAFNMTTGPAHWELLQRARAVDNQCFVLTASPARAAAAAAAAGETIYNDQDNDQDGKKSSKYPVYTAWGHSTAVSPWGTVLATTDEKPSLVMVDLDLDTIPVIRKSIPIAEQERKDIYQVVSTASSSSSKTTASSNK